MICYVCKTPKMRVTESFDAGEWVYRTRQCVNPECRTRFTTHECAVEETSIPKWVRDMNRKKAGVRDEAPCGGRQALPKKNPTVANTVSPDEDHTSS